MGVYPLEKVEFLSCGFVKLCIFLCFLNLAFHNFHIAEKKFGIYGVNIVCRIDFSVDMHDVIVFEAAYNMHNSLNLANVTEELVTETLALGGAFYKTCDIAELNSCVDCFL